jgi:hypothetical protein
VGEVARREPEPPARRRQQQQQRHRPRQAGHFGPARGQRAAAWPEEHGGRGGERGIPRPDRWVGAAVRTPQRIGSAHGTPPGLAYEFPVSKLGLYGRQTGQAL